MSVLANVAVPTPQLPRILASGTAARGFAITVLVGD